MIIAYRYKIGNQSIETGDINTIPQGIPYETFELQVVEDKVQVPETVTAIKLFGQLLIQGINEASLIAKIDFLVANSVITALQGDLAKVAIAKATIFERSHPFVTLIGSAFSIDIDQLFIDADNLAI
jgi:hypothetical protein